MRIAFWVPEYEGRERTTGVAIGMALVSAAAQQDGHETAILNWPDSITDMDAQKQIRDFRPQLIACGGLVTTFKYYRNVTRKLKKWFPRIPILMGGGLATALPMIVMQTMPVDHLCLGEGEEFIREYLRAIIGRKTLGDVTGLVYRDGRGQLVTTPARREIQNLDLLPTPDPRMVQPRPVSRTAPVESGPYQQENPMMGSVPFWPMQTSRSCPYRCPFCYHPLGQHFRYRSTDSVLAEVEYVLSLGYLAVQFSDEAFTSNKGRIVEMCEEINRRGLKFEWMALSRVDEVDDEFCIMLRSAGCRMLSFGMESASNRILKNIGKRTTQEQMERAVECARAADIEIYGSWMIGSPGETEETIRESVEFIKRLNLYLSNFFYFTPYPNSPVFLRLQEEGRIPDLIGFLESLANAVNLTFNMSDIPDDRLMALTAAAIRECKEHYARNARPEIIDMPKQPGDAHYITIRCSKAGCGNTWKVHPEAMFTRCRRCWRRYDQTHLLFQNALMAESGPGSGKD